MRLLLLFKTSPDSPTFNTPSSFGVQGNVLARGLAKIGEDCQIVDRRDEIKKVSAYQNFQPDFVIGIGYWGDIPEIVLHPLRFGQRPLPWLVADGAVLDYQANLNCLKLILATSNWVREVLIRDGVDAWRVKVVYEGVDTDVFKILPSDDPQVEKFRKKFKIDKDEIFLLTVGGEGMSKGFQEVIAALKLLGDKIPSWKYVVKVAASPIGKKQTLEDTALATKFGLQDRVIFFSEMLSRRDQAALFNAADIYAAPSHNEGFGRPLVEAQACGKPVLTVGGTATYEVVRHGVSGFAAKVGEKIYKKKFVFEGKEIEFKEPKLIGVKADPADLARYLLKLTDPNLRREMGKAARGFVLENFDYQKTAKEMVDVIKETFSGY